MSYTLLDSGGGQKLEKFGDIVLIRPCQHAIWRPKLPESEWKKASSRFSRESGNRWEDYDPLPETWEVLLHGIRLKLKRTDFGHLGVFPEHAYFWPWIQQHISKRKEPARILNLFAYSGGATLAAAAAGAHVCHLDSSKGMIAWARENAALNHLENHKIRWICDDVKKYLARAIRRGERYEGIILDPPSFGRGKSAEVFKIERDLPKILESCKELLSENSLFFLLTCHTPGYSPIVLKELMQDVLKEGKIEAGEMTLEGPALLPSGTYVKWSLC